MDASIEALDTRLRRLEYIVTGSTSTLDTAANKSDSPRGNIPNQISSLNDRLAKLVHNNKSIKKLLQTCDAEPSLLQPGPTPTNTDASLSQTEKLAIIFPSAPTYQQTSSLLLAVRDTPFPEETVSAEIASALPDVVRAQFSMMDKESEVAILMKQSVGLLERWYAVVEGFNACVAEWDERLRELEIKVSRRNKTLRDAETY